MYFTKVTNSCFHAVADRRWNNLCLYISALALPHMLLSTPIQPLLVSQSFRSSCPTFASQIRLLHSFSALYKITQGLLTYKFVSSAKMTHANDNEALSFRDEKNQDQQAQNNPLLC